MNEWTAAAPIVDETKPQPRRQPHASCRPLPRWAIGLATALAIFMTWSGALLLIFGAEYTMLEMVPAIALLALGEIVVIALIYPIAWRTGRLS